MGFADLSIKPPNIETLRDMVKTCRRLGYKILAYEAEIANLREPPSFEGVKLVPRATVKGSTRGEVWEGIRLVKERFKRRVLVAVEPLSLEALRYASVNKDVDIIRVNVDIIRFIDKSQARLFRERGWGSLEFPLSTVLKGFGLKPLYDAVFRADSFDVNFIIVSDAESAMELWSPPSIIGLLASMGVDRLKAVSWISSVPAYIVDRAGL
ncbi:MAG: RNase P subunit p30 family protein [Thermoprotei archaeon]|nr:RNase P subunit p30 family protein [Thermoprotei archaeon]